MEFSLFETLAIEQGKIRNIERHAVYRRFMANKVRSFFLAFFSLPNIFVYHSNWLPNR